MNQELKFLILIMIVLFTSCKNTVKESFKIEDSFFATRTNDEFRPLDEAVYSAGDDVYFFLKNVGPLSLDKDNKCRLDMDIEISNNYGEIVFKQNTMLGENGILHLPDRIAKNPYTVWHSDSMISAGEYTFKVIAYDKLSGKTKSVKKNFRLN